MGVKVRSDAFSAIVVLDKLISVGDAFVAAELAAEDTEELSVNVTLDAPDPVEAFSAIVPQIPSLSIEEEIKMPIEKWTLKNDFEDSIFPQFPELLEIKKSLIQEGALYASMSGSGSSIYGIFTEKPQLKFDNCQLFHQVL